MRIVRAEWVRRHLPCRPYRIAYETVDAADVVFVRLVTDGPHVGLGAGTPDAPVTGETLARCTEALGTACDALAGADPLRRAGLLAELGPLLVGAPAARSAIDQALHDLLGKQAGLPVHVLLGGCRSSVPTSITLGIDDVDTMVAEARRRVAEGFCALKLKGGVDVDHDVDVVTRVRAAIGHGIELRFDANQGYDADTALAFLRRVVDADVAILEQPTPRAAEGALRRVTRDGDTPVMADESLLDLGDALWLAAGARADMVNLKLMKVGGLDAGLQVNAVALAAGIDAMIGCMDESALSIAAGLHLALARPNIGHADLDGHLDLLEDPAAAAVRLEAGVLYPADGPGFGLADLLP